MNTTPAKKELKALWNSGFSSEVHRSAIAFLLLIGVSLIACLFLPELREKAIGQIFDLMAGKDLMTPDGRISFFALFANNMQACIITMLYGLIPFAYLVALPMGINAILLGVLAADAVANGSLSTFLLAILPHGIVELPALVLAFAMSAYVCGQMTRRCRKDKTAHSLLECMVLISRFLFIVLIPMLLAAALLEAWVTPMLLMLFQQF